MSNINQGQVSEYMERFINMFHLYDSALNGHRNEPISVLRREGFDMLTKEEFPSRRDEDWKYTSITPVINKKFTNAPKVAIAGGAMDFNTHFVSFSNGYLMNDLPEIDGVVVMTVSEALKNENYKAWIDGQLAKQGGTARNTFLPLNQAFGDSGIFIKVNKNCSVEKPIHISYLTKNTAPDQAFFTSPQLFVWMDSGSNATIIEEFTTTDIYNNSYFTNAANRIELGKNAALVHMKLQNESFDSHMINNTLVSQMRDSNYWHYAFDLGGGIVRNNLSVSLLDSNTESHLYGAFIGYKDQHIDNQSFIDHAMPHCQSNEMYKGILTDKSRGVFNGKVLVRQDAQKTNAFQQSSSLVLSPAAVMDTKPQLEIFADDVKCSHGATIGHLDESSVFYLNSRGLSERQAKSLLKRAFISEVVDHIENEDLRELAYERIEAKLNLMQI
jgi:Fe-S cluster assembly protein SufD